MNTLLLLAQTFTNLDMLAQNTPELSAARNKVERLLIAEIKAAERVSDLQTRAILNTCSAKILKALPKDAHIGTASMGNAVTLDVARILQQPKDVLVLAQKHGLRMSDNTYRALIEEAAGAQKTYTNPEQPKTILQIFAPSSSLFESLLHDAINTTAATAPRCGPLYAAALTRMVKLYPDIHEKALSEMTALFHPGAAHPLYYKKLAVLALLKAPKPKNAIYVHPDIKALVAALTSTAGRATILEQTKGLNAFLSGGHLLPVAFMQKCEKQRATWSNLQLA